MSQSIKLSLWQKIKPLLNTSTAQTVIDDIKITEDLRSRIDGHNQSRPLQNEPDSISIHPKNTGIGDICGLYSFPPRPYFQFLKNHLLLKTLSNKTFLILC